MSLKIFFLSLLTLVLLTETKVKGQEGNLFVVKPTKKDAASVANELKQLIEAKGMKIFCEISHHMEAKNAGEQLSFTEVITFGNPKVGTKLMQLDQRLGYVLPLKILVIRNDMGETKVLFVDPKKYKDDFTIKGSDSILIKMSDMLHELVDQVL